MDSQDSQRTLVDLTSQLVTPKKLSPLKSTLRRASPRIKAFSIYSDRQESSLRDVLSPKAPSLKLRMVCVEIPAGFPATLRVLSRSTPLQAPLQEVGQSRINSRPITSMLRKPELKVSFAKGRNWEKKQPNDHTSTLFSPFPSPLFL